MVSMRDQLNMNILGGTSLNGQEQPEVPFIAWVCFQNIYVHIKSIISTYYLHVPKLGGTVCSY